MIIYTSDNNISKNIILSNEFEQRIISHIISRFLNHVDFYKPPLYLFIEGDPGEGKTIQVIATCIKNKIALVHLSSSELSSGIESKSKKALEDAIEKAIELLNKMHYAAILIDDFHLGNANLRVDRTTVNSDILISHMMSLADKYAEQVPIILTGNDFSSTYYPLMRDGRADIYHWAPTEELKKEIAYQMLRPILTDKEYEDLKKFIKKYINQNIAFFAQLKNDVRLNVIQDVLREYKIVGEVSPEEISSNVYSRSFQISCGSLYDMANMRIASRIKNKEWGK